MNENSEKAGTDPDRGFWAVEPRTGEDGVPDIFFKVVKAGSPADQLTLKGQLEQALSVLLVIYSETNDVAKRDEAVGRLLSISQLGLVGPNPATPEAVAALQAFKVDIVNKEAGRIKNAYMLTLGWWASGFSAAAWLMYVVSQLFPQIFLDQLIAYRNTLLAIAGAMVGGWASFASRKVLLTFEDLWVLEEDKVEPPLRLAFTAVLTTTLVLTFATGLANVKIGGLSSALVLTSGSIATLIGVLAGLSEKALPGAIMKKADSFVTRS